MVWLDPFGYLSDLRCKPFALRESVYLREVLEHEFPHHFPNILGRLGMSGIITGQLQNVEQTMPQPFHLPPYSP